MSQSLHPPKDIGSAVAEGTGVPADFTLPWNTTRSMADVWADEIHQKRVAAGRRGGEAKARLHRVKLPPPPITPRGKLAYAGYDASEVHVKRYSK